MNSKQILCEHVNRLLRERHITKRELADGIGMDVSQLSKLLNGKYILCQKGKKNYYIVEAK